MEGFSAGQYPIRTGSSALRQWACWLLPSREEAAAPGGAV